MYPGSLPVSFLQEFNLLDRQRRRPATLVFPAVDGRDGDAGFRGETLPGQSERGAKGPGDLSRGLLGRASVSPFRVDGYSGMLQSG
jgi:hypothetical protein